MLSAVSSNNPNFTASYHTYFYTTDGRRIVSDENMKKCLHYVEAHLNNSKRVKVRNMDLVDTMKFGQPGNNGKRIGGDSDYLYNPKIRAVFDKAKEKVQGFVTIVTGRDADIVSEKYGKPIGRAKRTSLERTGSTKSFETKYAVSRYQQNAPEYAESRAVYRGDKRIAFGVCFEPKYKKNGELKGFEYHHSGFFNENSVK